MPKTVTISMEQDPETSGYTVLVQHESGWIAKLVSGLGLEDALKIAASDLERLTGPEVEFRVGAQVCASVEQAIDALRTEATVHQRSETRLRAGVEAFSDEEAETLPVKRGASHSGT